MADFTIVVADPDSGESHQIDVDGQDANRFIGRELGDEVDGDPVGLDGYTLELAGGSDTSGRPMRDDVRSANTVEILSDGGTGYKPARNGQRKRITVRGREISEDTRQINATITERGSESVAALLGESDDE